MKENQKDSLKEQLESQDIEVSDDTDEEDDVLELEDANGKTVRYELLDVVPYEDNEYICVVPYLDEDAPETEESDEVEIYRVVPAESDDQDELYVSVNSQEELSAVYDEFKKRNADVFNFED